MASDRKKLLVVQVAGLGHGLLTGQMKAPVSHALRFQAIDSVFPAVTSTVQASFRTATLPSQHGMVANGYMDRSLAKTFFWEQSAALVAGPRIWDEFRSRGKKVGLLFWQQSLGESADVVLSPAPIHMHHGGMIQSCHSKPAHLYDKISAALGAPFDLKYYWGPLASPRSSVWICDATRAVISDPDEAPDLCLTYLPALDYDLQRFGPHHEKCIKPFCSLLSQLEKLCDAAEQNGYEILIFGDYAIAECDKGPVYPNIALNELGLLKTRTVRGMQYTDIYNSRAFAVVDHEVAHVYVKKPGDVAGIKKLLASKAGVESVIDRQEQEIAGIANARSGDLVMTAENGYWFAYNFWRTSEHPPEYAAHVDIHQKPGFDPCELFFDWLPWRTSIDARRIKGSHGRLGSDRKVAWVSSFIESEPVNIIDLAIEVRNWLNRHE